MDDEAATAGGAAAQCSAKKVKTVAGIIVLVTVLLALLFISIHAPAPGRSTDRLKLVCAVVVLSLAFMGSLAAYLVCYRLRPRDQVHPVMPNIISDRSLVAHPPPLA